MRVGSGGRGATGGNDAGIFELSEPEWETGDDRVMLEGSQCVVISSPLDISVVVAPGACKSQPSHFSGLRDGWWSTAR